MNRKYPKWLRKVAAELDRDPADVAAFLEVHSLIHAGKRAEAIRLITAEEITVSDKDGTEIDDPAEVADHLAGELAGELEKYNLA